MRKRKVVRQKSSKVKYTIDSVKAESLVEDAFNNGCLLWIDGGAWGNRKKVSKEELASAGFNPSTTRAVRDLVSRERINEVVSPINRAHNWARANSMPWLNNSVHFIHKNKVEEATEYLKGLQKELADNVDELVGEYEALKDKAREEDPKSWNPSNYPSSWELKKKFKLRFGFNLVAMPSGGSGKVSVLSEDVMREEDRKFKAMVRETFEESVKLIRSAFRDSISHLSTVLSDPNKKFQASTVEKPKEFLEEFFRSMNIYGDTPFAELAIKLRKMLDGVHADDLRDDGVYRHQIATAVNRMVKAFDSLPVIEIERDIEL